MIAHIFNIQRFCLYDGPGIRTTVFFKGCPLHCVWCHNPESQSIKPQMMFTAAKCVSCGKCVAPCPARSFDSAVVFHPDACTLCGKCIQVCPCGANKVAGEALDTDEILKQVFRDKPFYRQNGGLTLSGGEPSMQAKAALALINGARQKDIFTVIETCGYGKKEFFEESASLNAMFYFDLKAAIDEMHTALTGGSNELILQNLENLFRLGAYVVLRLPLVPGMNDSHEALSALRQKLTEYKNYYHHAEIMSYHILGKGKAQALGTEYKAPLQNAGQEDIERWRKELNASENRIILSNEVGV